MSKRVSLRKKRKIKDINDSRIEIDIEDKIISNYSIQLPIMLDRVKNIPLPNKDEQLRIVTVKTLSSVHFIEKITRCEKVIESYLVVFSISRKSGFILNDLIEKGKLGDVTILMSNFMTRNNESKKTIIDVFLKNKNIRLKTTTSHAKVILVKTTENYYILEGSMNLSVNARIEQLTFENSEKIYNFHKEWINEVFNQINQK